MSSNGFYRLIEKFRASKENSSAAVVNSFYESTDGSGTAASSGDGGFPASPPSTDVPKILLKDTDHSPSFSQMMKTKISMSNRNQNQNDFANIQSVQSYSCKTLRPPIGPKSFV